MADTKTTSAARRAPQTRKLESVQHEQRDADAAAAQEFHQIKEFVAACRRQWPGAKIALRPTQDGAPAGANVPPTTSQSHQKETL